MPALREGFTVERRLLETASSSRFWTALNGEADANSDGRVTIGELANFISKQKPQAGQPFIVQNGLPGDLPLVEVTTSKSKAN